MSQSVSVASAVAIQLTIEGHWPPNDLNKSMGTNYSYNTLSMGGFLSAVQVRLAASTPSYNFTFNAAFVANALGLTVVALVGAIDSNTT